MTHPLTHSMDVIETIAARRSVRKFSDRAVEQEKLDRIADAGRLAPTARNEQRCRAVFARDRKTVSDIAGACDGYPWVAAAPVVIAVYADDDRKMMCGQSSKTVDCSIAMSFMMLEATELGLGSVWMGHFDAGAVKRILHIPEDRVLVAVMPVGYPADEGAPKDKLPREDFVSYDRA